MKESRKMVSWFILLCEFHHVETSEQGARARFGSAQERRREKEPKYKSGWNGKSWDVEI
jgi:hypothetical protein